MRVRVVKPIYLEHTKIGYRGGEVVNLPKDLAEGLLKAGIAMEDKSKDGPKEVKA